MFVTSFEKGLQVLETVGRADHSLSLVEITERSGLNKSAAQRFAFTLSALGYLEKDSLTKRYSLGPKLVEFGSFLHHSDELIRSVAPVFADCNAKWDEAVALFRLDGTAITCVYCLPSRYSININLRSGGKMPAFCTAMGRSILAFLPNERVETLLRRSHFRAHTSRTITDIDKIERALRRIRRDGFAIVDEERTAGEISIAAPVFGRRNMVVASLGIVAPAARWSANTARSTLGPVVAELARTISTSASFQLAINGISGGSKNNNLLDPIAD
ncbi:IclR family transcriptional regulator [Bradyrhizobium sp. 1.29L]